MLWPVVGRVCLPELLRSSVGRMHRSQRDSSRFSRDWREVKLFYKSRAIRARREGVLWSSLEKDLSVPYRVERPASGSKNR